VEGHPLKENTHRFAMGCSAWAMAAAVRASISWWDGFRVGVRGGDGGERRKKGESGAQWAGCRFCVPLLLAPRPRPPPRPARPAHPQTRLHGHAGCRAGRPGPPGQGRPGSTWVALFFFPFFFLVSFSASAALAPVERCATRAQALGHSNKKKKKTRERPRDPFPFPSTRRRALARPSPPGCASAHPPCAA